MLGCCLRSDALLRRRPQVQFLLLAALNEALASLAAPSSDSATLSDAQRDEVRQPPPPHTRPPRSHLGAVVMNRRSKSPGHSPAVAQPLCSVPHGFVAVVDIAYFCNLPLCVSCGAAMCADPDRTTSPGHSGI